MEKLITRILLIASLIGIPFSAWFFLDDYYAKASEVVQIQQSIQQLDKRLEQKIIQDQIDYKQKRVYELEDRYEDKKISKEIKQELFDLKDEIEKLKNKLKNENNK